MQVDVRVPAVGESISDVVIVQWHKEEGDTVREGEPLVELETDKASVEVPAPASGVLGALRKEPGETAAVGEVLTTVVSAPAPEAVHVMPAARRALAEHGLSAEGVTPTGPGGRLLKEDVERHVGDDRGAPAPASLEKAAPMPDQPAPALNRVTETSAAEEPAGRRERIVPMSPIRRRIAQRLVQARQEGALLTTFNDVDMTRVIELRRQLGEQFQRRHGVKLGFMSFFVKATVAALQEVPELNATVRGTDIVYYDYCDIGIAVGSERGLVVPVLRNAESLGFAAIERAIADFAERARNNTLRVEELQGGTFTISNGGVFGSLLSTPIVNPPQSGVLGLHRIEERPVARDGAVVVRPMMYLALTYDHRIVDGREAVGFLRRVKEAIEDPARILLEV